MAHQYILDGKTPIPEPDLLKWARWYETADRQVAHAEMADCSVSTIFIGLDYSYGRKENPVVFETMVFGGKHDRHTERCATWDEAEAMHARITAMIHGGYS